jgi:hypothetical protein
MVIFISCVIAVCVAVVNYSYNSQPLTPEEREEQAEEMLTW